MSLVTLATAKDILGLSSTGSEDDRISALLPSAEGAVLRLTGFVEKAAVTHTYDGHGDYRLVLKKARPNPIDTSAAVEVRVDTARAFAASSILPASAYELDPDNWMLYRLGGGGGLFEGGSWPAAPRCVRITHTIGHTEDTFPAELSELIARLVSAKSNTIGREGAESVRIGSFSIKTAAQAEELVPGAADVIAGYSFDGVAVR